MESANQIMINAPIIIEGIAFDVVSDTAKKLLARDLYNPNNKASFVVRGQELVLSVSSFCDKSREQALSDAIRINTRMLVDEVQNA